MLPLPSSNPRVESSLLGSVFEGFTNVQQSPTDTDSPSILQSLLWLPRVVLFAVGIRMVFQRLQMSRDFSGHA